MSTLRKLADYTPDEQNELPYADLCAVREAAYRAHVAALELPEGAKAWAATMARRFGPRVKVWHNTMGWLEALFVVRYGEEPAHWPTTFSAADQAKADAWARGTLPSGVTHL